MWEDWWTQLSYLWNSWILSIQMLPDLIQDIPDVIAHDTIVVAVTLSIIALINVAFLLFKPRGRRAKMTKEERRLYERRLISDAITDAIEDKVYRKEISSNTAQHWYFLIGHRCGLTDLFPKPPPKPPLPDQSILKTQIRERLINLWKTKKPLPVPKEKTKEKVVKFLRPRKTA